MGLHCKTERCPLPTALQRRCQPLQGRCSALCPPRPDQIPSRGPQGKARLSSVLLSSSEASANAGCLATDGRVSACSQNSETTPMPASPTRLHTSRSASSSSEAEGWQSPCPTYARPRAKQVSIETRHNEALPIEGGTSRTAGSTPSSSNPCPHEPRRRTDEDCAASCDTAHTCASPWHKQSLGGEKAESNWSQLGATTRLAQKMAALMMMRMMLMMIR